MWASWQCKASKLVGCQRLGTWQLPRGNPWYNHWDFFCEVGIVWALLTNNVGPLGETYVLKTLTHQVKQCWTIFLLGFRKSSEYLWLEVQKLEREEVFGSKSCLVRCNVSCDDVLWSFFEGDLDLINMCQALLKNLSGMSLTPREA